jgi:demethylmenaquinone methyltransferase/2-methoxy-6-polyprenyl-1,4-benzoquinol methylase
VPNVYYDPGRERGAKVDELFTQIAPRYDLVNDLQSFGLHRLWKRRMAALSRVKMGENALDICCGTGDVSFLLSRQGARVTGLDFNLKMLSVAEQRKAKGINTASSASGSLANPDPEFTRGDALNLPFPAGTFDIVTVAYGLRNLASWEAGLKEMIRVSRPGARILVLEFGKPENELWRRTYFAYLRAFVPVLGKIFCGNSQAYSYILESLKHYPGQAGLRSKMELLGLANVQVVNFIGGIMSINYGEVPGTDPTKSS